MSIDRIATDHRVAAIIALDSFDLIAERIERLVPAGRRLTLAHNRATYVGNPPDLFPGLTVGERRKNSATHSMWVECLLNGDPEIGFGIGIRDTLTAATEEKAWDHFHARRHHVEAIERRRRDVTYVEVVGGRDGDNLSRSDSILIRTYMGNGICDERVIAFEDCGR